MTGRPQIKLTGAVSIAFETNGKGYLGFIVELPGAFIRGFTEQDALIKVKKEVSSYLKWLGCEQRHEYSIQVVQRHRSSLPVEDADNEVLLRADEQSMTEEEFRSLYDLVWYSGETFLKLYTDSRLKDWIDESRIRKTFYGNNPKTIQEVFDHVRHCQYYYLSRMKIEEEIEGDFITVREFCLEQLEASYRKNDSPLKFQVANELWTLKKVLRRFIWHDRIHGKAITRILEKQRQLRLIREYDSPFHFFK